MTWRRAACAAVAALAVAGSEAAGQVARHPLDAAWDSSFVLERVGRAGEAAALLRGAFGEFPATYAVCSRLAWLAYLDGAYGESARLYERARILPGALAEAASGQAMALAAEGWVAIADGALARARGLLAEAAALDSVAAGVREGLAQVGMPGTAAPEAWGAAIGAARGSSRAGVAYLHLPIQLDDTRAVRFAGRLVLGATASPAASAFFGAQQEFFVGYAQDVGRSQWQAMGFVLSNVLGTTAGGAGTWRFGGRRGIAALAAGSARPGATNVQLAPSAWAWLGDHVVLSVGVRTTLDSGVARVSPMGAMAVAGSRGLLDVRGHVGRERLAFDASGPTVLSFGAWTTAGATVTAVWRPSDRWQAFAQGQAEALEDPSVNGRWYGSLGFGIRMVRPWAFTQWK